MTDLSFNYFDTLGIERAKAISRAKEAIQGTASGLNCGETKFGQYRYTNHKAISYYVPMINEYKLTGLISYTVTKNCYTSGCCKSLSVTWSLSFDANDSIEFKKGAADGFAVPPYWVHDRLVGACFAGKDFAASAHWGQMESVDLPCKGRPRSNSMIDIQLTRRGCFRDRLTTPSLQFCLR